MRHLKLERERRLTSKLHDELSGEKKALAGLIGEGEVGD